MRIEALSENEVMDDELENDDDLESDVEEDAEKILKSSWISLSPPVNEDDIIGKWYGCIYGDKNHSCMSQKLKNAFLLMRVVQWKPY